ncbi:4-hydroxyphenylacetate 3-hydroxylase N-terminal domain-containing protein [Pseudomonas chlororaphis]|uniref:4-hydroxyphenylacetate 3-hydroxylase N-terminal domain-containing protein n=1 Tax=Pseudomonas chlororaphis TaxID=587753 RepID=UPI0018AFACE7|nr:4-hydroxyphenylacetate 3-hydroxylase N-terminal domain-containing protein [Pseudomonas chlororaphis]
MIRRGVDYLNDITDGRVIWLGDRKIISVVEDKAFYRGATAFASLFEQAAADPALFYSDAGGESTAKHNFAAFKPCKSLDELAAKHKLHAAWSESTFGFIGRSPDYIAAGLSGFIVAPDTFQGKYYDGRYALSSLYERAMEGNLFISFALTNIKRDRAKPLSMGENQASQIGVRATRETESGIFVSGVKGIGTAAVFSDEIIVGSIEPLQDSDMDYALTFCVQPGTSGVELISRDSYSSCRNIDDAPISSMLDENDAILVLKDVFISWDRVLTYKDVQTTFGIWWKTPAYVNMAHQASIRFYKKLEFLAGLAYLVGRSNGSLSISEVRGVLGRLVGYAQLAKSIAYGAEREFDTHSSGADFVFPNRLATYAQRIFAAEVYPKFIHEIRMLCGGSLIYLPATISDFDNPEVGEALRLYWGGESADPVDRARLFKLAWDVTSTEFGARHAHYEQFYQGAPHVYLNQMAEYSHLEALGEIAERALNRSI